MEGNPPLSRKSVLTNSNLFYMHHYDFGISECFPAGSSHPPSSELPGLFCLFREPGSTLLKMESSTCGLMSHLESFSFSAFRRLASWAFSAIHLVTNSWFSSVVFLSFSSKAVNVICRASYSSFRVWLALSRSCSLLRSSWHSVSRSEIVCKHSAILKAGCGEKEWGHSGAP